MTRERLSLVVAKAAIAASGILLFLLPLATPPGLLAGVSGTIAGYLVARRATAAGLRLPAGLFLALVTIAAGHFVSQWLLDNAPGGGTASTIQAADAVFFGLGTLGAFFGLRLLSQRARVFSVVELAVVVAAVAHTFADHRHHRIHQPRFFSDWAWSQGIDPATVLAAAGVAVVVLAAVMLLDTQRGGKLLVSFLLLLIGGLGVFLLFGNMRIATPPDTNGLGLTKGEKEDKDDKNGGKGDGGGSSSRPPDPVAVVLLHDDLPDANVLYFRQAVLSRFAVDRLVEDTSGQFDRDVFTAFPAGEPLQVVSPQQPAFHRRLYTSMFLLVDHAQPVGLGHPTALLPLANPDPRRFVAAYDVASLFYDPDVRRLVGRTALPAGWSEEERRHYLAIPDDPRYLALSKRLVRDMDPRFVGDDVMVALAIKRYLEKQGFYSLKQRQLVGNDPTAKFLFGDMRGYCVHFAHAATMLLRSQGIPARVALGYAVQTNRRGAGSSILILGSEAHAWPELFLDGVGWVTFDIYPENSDQPPPAPIDVDLESLLGELARKDKTGGKADPGTEWVIAWGAIGRALAALFGGLFAVAYAVKGARGVRRSTPRLVYRGVLDRLSDRGAVRRFGETRERHAQRLAALAPSFVPLTRAHLRAALGRRDPEAASGGPADGDPGARRSRATWSRRAAESRRNKEDHNDLSALARQTRAELRQNTPFWTRLGAFLNPIGWWFTR